MKTTKKVVKNETNKEQPVVKQDDSMAKILALYDLLESRVSQLESAILTQNDKLSRAATRLGI